MPVRHLKMSNAQASGQASSATVPVHMKQTLVHVPQRPSGETFSQPQQFCVRSALQVAGNADENHEPGGSTHEQPSSASQAAAELLNKLHCAVLPGPTQSSPQQLFVGSHAPSTTSSANVSRESRAAPVSQPPPTFVRHSGSSRGSGAVTCWPAACGGLSATRATAASLGRMVLKQQQPGARQRLAGGAPLVVRSICDAAPPARPGCREFCSLCTSGRARAVPRYAHALSSAQLRSSGPVSGDGMRQLRANRPLG